MFASIFGKWQRDLTPNNTGATAVAEMDHPESSMCTPPSSLCLNLRGYPIDDWKSAVECTAEGQVPWDGPVVLLLSALAEKC